MFTIKIAFKGVLTQSSAVSKFYNMLICGAPIISIYVTVFVDLSFTEKWAEEGASVGHLQ